MKILISGDFCDRYRVSEHIATYRFGELFENARPLIEDADFSVVNFEFPIVTKDENPIPKCGPNLKGQKASIDAIKYAGFNVCTLANNHILDQGEKCCVETKELLESAGIKTVGAGKDLADASKILYLQKGTERLAIINCCEHEFTIATDKSAGANPLNPVQQFYKIQEAKKNADYVLVIVHGGHEQFQLPSPRMKETYRFFIDAGADAVVNHHQHCYSGFEEYKSKPIFYGLGNLLFDDPNARNSTWNEGYMVRLNFTINSIAFDIIPYQQCNENVGVQILEDRHDFDLNLTRLNAIIADDSSLQKEVADYYESCAKYQLSILEPYKNRVFSKLFRIGLLPKVIKGKKKFAVLNHIHCESHIDKLIYALKNNQ
ncbi:MAG: CapA family protein [Bacteroidales bacterium]|nr:CapA family protein [Candidatus Physcocola equi]